MKRTPFDRLNSVYAHMLALAFCIVATLSAYNLFLAELYDQRRTPRLSIYELSRLVADQPLAGQRPTIEMDIRRGSMPAPPSDAEKLLTRVLAERLGLPIERVRVYLGPGDRRRWTRRLAVYGPQSAADPVIDGAFTIAVANSAEHWRIYQRTVPRPIGVWLIVISLLLLALFAVLSLWFGSRLAKPIRRFADAAAQMRIGAGSKPIEVVGPTELRQAADAINEMNVRIGRFVRERASITAAVAHDLRSPLSRIQFHIASAPPAIREAVESEIGDMEKMVALTLDFVESETRQIAREPIELQQFVEGIVDNFHDLGEPVRLLDGQDIRIEGDPLLLKRLLNNLIDNALRYGNRAYVSVQRSPNGACVEVLDDGPGMTPEVVERAFEPFFRGEASRNRNTGGVGLGLSIARAAARSHGGDLQLENRSEGGLRARITLPSHP